MRKIFRAAIILGVSLPTGIPLRAEEFTPDRKEEPSTPQATRPDGLTAPNVKQLLKQSQPKQNRQAEVPKVDVPQMDEDDYQLYATVMNLLPDTGTALEYLDTVASSRIEAGKAPGPAIQYLWGNLSFRMDKPSVALEHYETALELFPNYRKAYLEAGMAAYQLEEREKAIGYLEKGLVAGGISREPHLFDLLGNLYREEGETEKSIEAFQAALSQDPGYLNAHLHLADIYLREDKPDDALEHLLKSISLGGGSAFTYRSLATIYNGRGNHAVALAALENAQLFEPEESSLKVFRLNLLYQLGRYREVVALAEDLLGDDGGDQNLWLSLALAQLQLGDLEGSTVSYEMALQLDEIPGSSMLDLSALYARQDLPEKGAEILREALEEFLAGLSSEQVFQLAGHFLGTTSPEMEKSLLEAMEDWAEQSNLHEPSPMLPILKADYLIRSGQLPAAGAILEAAVGRFPEDGRIHLLSGDVALASNDPVGARISYERAAMDLEVRPGALVKLAMLEVSQGKVEEGLELLIEAHALRPGRTLWSFILRLGRQYRIPVDPLMERAVRDKSPDRNRSAN